LNFDRLRSGLEAMGANHRNEVTMHGWRISIFDKTPSPHEIIARGLLAINGDGGRETTTLPPL
jgi:hypothetical protein